MNKKTLFCAGIIGMTLLASGCGTNSNQNKNDSAIGNSINNGMTDEFRDGLQNNFSDVGNNDDFDYDYNSDRNYRRRGNSINITGATSSPNYRTYTDNYDVVDDYWGSFRDGIVTSENYKLDNSWMPNQNR